MYKWLAVVLLAVVLPSLANPQRPEPNFRQAEIIFRQPEVNFRQPEINFRQQQQFSTQVQPQAQDNSNGVWVPVSPCPNQFEYQWYNGEVVGTVSVPAPRLVGSENIVLVVKLAMEQFASTGSSGTVELLEDKEYLVSRLRSGDQRPIQYRVRFPPSSSLPSLNSIEINGRLVCTGRAATSGAMTVLTLNHTVKPGGSTGPGQPNSFQQPQQGPWQQPLTTTTPSTTIPPWFTTPSTTPQPSYSRPTTPNPWQNQPLAPVEPNPVVVPQSRPQPNLQINIGINNGGLGTELCGQPVAASNLVLNGQATSKGQWPWLTAIFIKTDVGTNFQCGGSLVSTSHVVTAAHCIKDPDRPALSPQAIIVYVGKFNLLSAEPESQPRDISRVVLHPGYGSGKYDNDIAVLVLETSVQISRHIMPVCLGPANPPTSLLTKRGIVVGWGRDERGNRVTGEPRMATMPVVSQEECLRSHRNFYYLTSDNTFCAGGRDGSGPCNGDSGGGMYFREGSRWTLRGVVSLSLQDEDTKACDLHNYIVFTDVSKFSDWIRNIINTSK